MKKDLLKMLDLSAREIVRILDMGDQMKFNHIHGLSHTYLQGKTLAMIFDKSSTRTRVSFEAGMFHLGGHAIYLPSSGSQLGRGEPIADTARTLERYCDGIMIRTFHQSVVEELASRVRIPVINGLTDFAHPCQVLADLMTVREYKTKLDGLHLCFVGDGNNMANSLIVGGLKCGMTVSVATPPGYEPDPVVLDFARTHHAGALTLTNDPREAVRGADAVFTDVWASMGQEEEQARRKVDFAGFQLTGELMALAQPDALVQHCLPAHRGEEISEELFEAHADEIFNEAENRLHAQKAVMYLLMGSER